VGLLLLSRLSDSDAGCFGWSTSPWFPAAATTTTSRPRLDTAVDSSSGGRPSSADLAGASRGRRAGPAGDANGAPHPAPASYAGKFTGRYEHRTSSGGVGHNLPQEAPQEFARAILDAAG